MTINSELNSLGQLWVKNIKGDVLTVNEAFSSIFIKYQNSNTTFFNELTANKIKRFDTFYDSFLIQTNSGYIFEKYFVQGYDFKPYNKINNFQSQKTSNPFTNFEKPTNFDYWFDENEKVIYFFEFDSYNAQAPTIDLKYSQIKYKFNFKKFDTKTNIIESLLTQTVSFWLENPKLFFNTNGVKGEPRLTYNEDTKTFNVSFLVRNDVKEFGIISMNFKKDKVLEVNTYIPFGKVMPLDFTPPPYSGNIPTISCTASGIEGDQGFDTYLVDFGFETGEAGIFYNSFDIPDKFTIIWNNQIYTTGYVGSSDFNNALIDKGIDSSEIKTGKVSTGKGYLKFNKDLSSPNVAIVIVDAPLGNTGWEWKPFCPTNSCWKTNVYFDYVGSQPGRSCDPQIKQTKTITIPSNITLPANATIDYGADDDIAINGVRLVNGCAGGEGTLNLTFNTRTLVLDLIDTVGVNWGGYILFDICSTLPTPTPTRTPTPTVTSGLTPTPPPTPSVTPTRTPTPTPTLPGPLTLQSLYVSFD